MKQGTMSLGIWLALCGAVAPMPATAQMAASGNQIVHFMGRILNQTCEVKSSSRQMTVMLPDVRRTLLQQKGQTAGSTAFQIELEHCTDQADKPYIMFQNANAADNDGNLKNTAMNGAKNVAVQLLLAEPESVIRLNQPMTSKPKQAQMSSSGMATLKYKAQYYATGAATAGSVQASVNYVIAYH